LAEITALLDACVLYPAALRDLLMHLALEDLFRPKWTEAIHDEWIRSLLLNRPDLDWRRLNRTRRLMNRAVPDATVEGYERWIEQVGLPDPQDRHVVAAAIEGGVESIVTFNVKHFPKSVLSTYGIEAEQPDSFVGRLLSFDEAAVCAAVKRQRENLGNPRTSVEHFLSTLDKQGLKSVAFVLRQLGDWI
jgi:hypothetical protein